jgi:hypothetical protein
MPAVVAGLAARLPLAAVSWAQAGDQQDREITGFG